MSARELKTSKHSCEHCPAWSKHNIDGKESLVEARDREGKPVTKDGVTQYEKGDDGRLLTNGNCCLKMPEIITMMGIVTGFPTTKSNWFCHDPAKYAMLDRMRAEAENANDRNATTALAERGSARPRVGRGNH